jgi:hypothetical protein
MEVTAEDAFLHPQSFGLHAVFRTGLSVQEVTLDRTGVIDKT